MCLLASELERQASHGTQIGGEVGQEVLLDLPALYL